MKTKLINTAWVAVKRETVCVFIAGTLSWLARKRDRSLRSLMATLSVVRRQAASFLLSKRVFMLPMPGDSHHHYYLFLLNFLVFLFLTASVTKLILYSLILSEFLWFFSYFTHCEANLLIIKNNQNIDFWKQTSLVMKCKQLFLTQLQKAKKWL